MKGKARRVLCDALLMPDTNYVLLGAIPLEAMDIIVSLCEELVRAPGEQTLHRV